MLKRVTFTGFDQWTKPDALQAFYQQYPFVEFAFLCTENPNGGNRFPGPVMLRAYRKANLTMAVHLCGRLARYPVKTDDWSPVEDMLGTSFALFDRIQLNISKTDRFSRELVFPEGKQIIIQLHGGTRSFFDHYKHLPNVQGFQDDSGGRGVVCTEWMKPETPFFGYSGGIGPENAVQAVRAMNEVCEGDFWIDMESSIRTNDRFDVSKCRAVCEALVKAQLVTI